LPASFAVLLGIWILARRWWKGRRLDRVWGQGRWFVLPEEERPKSRSSLLSKPFGDPVGEPPEIVHHVLSLRRRRWQPAEDRLRMRRLGHRIRSTMVAIPTTNATITSSHTNSVPGGIVLGRCMA
jgi:hypothetical protein